MKNILFIDRYNNFLSQVVEAYARKFFPEKYQVYSGGIEEREIDPILKKILKEDGVNISESYSKLAYMFVDIPFDYIIFLVDGLKDEVMVLPQTNKVLEEKLSLNEDNVPADEKSREEYYRKVVEQLKNWVKKRLG